MDQTQKVVKVVIVEDNASLAEIYKIRLELLGYTCFAAYDGEVALKLIEQELPSLVLLDLMVPKIAGDQILATMRASEWGKNIKVLIISNLNEAEAPAGLRERGIEGYAVKANLSNDQLDRLVDTILKPANQMEAVDLEATTETRVVHTPLSELNTTPAAPIDLVITRVLQAPVSRVWAAWTDPTNISVWWGPAGYNCPQANCNVYEGGLSVIGLQSASSVDAPITYGSLAYTIIEANQRLEFIHNVCDANGKKLDPASLGLPATFPQSQRHEIVFKSIAIDTTELTVIEHGWPTEAMRESSRLGLEQCLDKLQNFIASQQV
ncbi:response regulator [Polaromonas sp.]|nr:response regulator [Candidatus Saccharibacteria bacterium]